MPVHKTKQLASQIDKIEKAGERVIAVLKEEDGYTIVTRLPENNTGRAWLPKGSLETRS